MKLIIYLLNQLKHQWNTDFIYIMSLGFDGLYKIGRGDPRSRLSSGKIFNPKLRLVAIAPTVNATETEAQLHRKYQRLRLSKDTFKFTQNDINEITDYMDGLYDL